MWSFWIVTEQARQPDWRWLTAYTAYYNHHHSHQALDNHHQLRHSNSSAQSSSTDFLYLFDDFHKPCVEHFLAAFNLTCQYKKRKKLSLLSNVGL